MYDLFHVCHRDVLEMKKVMQDSKQYLMVLREAAGGTDSIESLRPTEVRGVATEWEIRSVAK